MFFLFVSVEAYYLKVITGFYNTSEILYESFPGLDHRHELENIWNKFSELLYSTNVPHLSSF